MNVGMVGLIAAVLAGPALVAFADGRMGPDEVGVRVLLAVVVAMVAEGIARRFVLAVRPLPARHPAPPAGAALSDGPATRRADDA